MTSEQPHLPHRPGPSSLSTDILQPKEHTCVFQHNHQTPVLQYASYLYTQTKLPVYDKWPKVKPKKYINLALIEKDNITKQEAHQFTGDTYYGNIDDIKKSKRGIDIDQLAQMSDGSQPKCILVEGAPGVGKETLGLMQCAPELYADKGAAVSYNFLHLTVQECLAAFHLSQQAVEKQIDHLREYKEVKRQKQQHYHFHMVLRFLCGFRKFDSYPSEVLNTLCIERYGDDSASVVPFDTLHWLFEAQDNDVITNVLTFSLPLMNIGQ